MKETTEKIVVNFPENSNVATVRVIQLDNDPTQLPVVEPLPIEIVGTIDAVAAYLEKRLGTGQFEQKDCHIEVERESMSIVLITNETDARTRAVIGGQLKYHPKYLQFGINSDKTWEPMQLSRFFKLNNSFFPDKNANMVLVSKLKSFNATIQQRVEKMQSENGSRTDNFSQVVDSNLPGTFTLQLPIFKGRPTETVEVEFVSEVDGRNIKLSLCSPGAEVVVEEERNRAIDEQLATIRELAPGIAIIEL